MHTRRRRHSGRRRTSLAAAAPHVLIVDEDPHAAEQASDALSQIGYAAMVPTTAAAALRCLSVRSYDCILLDLGRG